MQDGRNAGSLPWNFKLPSVIHERDPKFLLKRINHTERTKECQFADSLYFSPETLLFERLLQFLGAIKPTKREVLCTGFKGMQWGFWNKLRHKSK